MEGESPLLKDGGNAAKPLLTRFCVAKSVISPSKPPSLTENFPHVPATYKVKICFAFCVWQGHGGAFLLPWEVGSCCRVRLSRSFCVWNLGTRVRYNL